MGGEAQDCKDTFYSNLSKLPAVDFGDGRTFDVRLARYGSAELEAAEERGDYEMAPLELQLIAKRAGASGDPEADIQHWPSHFKLLGYQCAGSIRTDSTSFVELLDTANEKRMRNAHYSEEALAPT